MSWICEIYGNQYTETIFKWLETCDLKSITKWASGNKKIDEFIQEMQLKINSSCEWIPYNQFDNIEEISKGDVATVYSAIWKNGPLKYNHNKNVYTRESNNKKVGLKCFHTCNSENITNELLNEVLKILIYFFFKYNYLFIICL